METYYLLKLCVLSTECVLIDDGCQKETPKSDLFSDSRIITYDAKLIAADIK